MDSSKVDKILARALYPPILFDDEYDTFMEDRDGRLGVVMDAAIQIARF